MTSFAYEAKDGMMDKFEKDAEKKKTKMFNKEEGSIILDL